MLLCCATLFSDLRKCAPASIALDHTDGAQLPLDRDPGSVTTSMPIGTIIPSEQGGSLHQKFKVVFLGEEKGTNNLSINYYIYLFLVGKSSLITRFMHDSVDDTYQVNFDVFSFS